MSEIIAGTSPGRGQNQTGEARVEPDPGTSPGSLLLAQFTDIAQQLNRYPSVEETLQAVLSQAHRAQLGDGFGILLIRDHSITCVAASDPEVQRADQLQLDADEGPVLDTILQQRNEVVVDLSLDDRWPTWASQALELGWRSTLAVGLREADTVGALTVYARTPSSGAALDLGLVQAFGAHAAMAVANARQRENLTQALQGRNLIGQAQGILMERFQIDAEQSFNVLRRYSSHSNRKLRQVAEDVVRLRRLPTEPARGRRAG